MSTVEPPKAFEDVVLFHLPDVTDPGAFTSHTPLGSLGLDSMGMIALMASLENAFDFTFPEEDVTTAAFYSADSLWSVVSRLIRHDG
ncbi:phosphopantetheine-binding protein [Dactylosporangium sp. NPDC051485]|uniref:phosphopantetheine-binding protein n=1 Tax=Dactylosporangium sp. NPDC051485 TaxID=3154846 RepID=UPI0034343AAA